MSWLKIISGLKIPSRLKSIVALYFVKCFGHLSINC